MVGFIWDLSQGHGEVISRSQQGQISSKRLKIDFWTSTSNNSVGTQLKIFCFCCFSTIMFTLDGKVILRSQRGQISYTKRVIIACFWLVYKNTQGGGYRWIRGLLFIVFIFQHTRRHSIRTSTARNKSDILSPIQHHH